MGRLEGFFVVGRLRLCILKGGVVRGQGWYSDVTLIVQCKFKGSHPLLWGKRVSSAAAAAAVGRCRVQA